MKVIRMHRGKGGDVDAAVRLARQVIKKRAKVAA
jgi:hypothetical protein